MKKTVLACALLVFFMSVLATSASQAATLQIHAKLLKENVRSGADIVIEATFTNTGSGSLQLTDTSGYRIQIVDGVGRDVSNKRAGYRGESSSLENGRTKFMPTTLRPGETKMVRLEFTPSTDFIMQGQYKLRVCLSGDQHKWDQCSEYKELTVIP